MDKPALNITVFSDYICPFCYIGYARVEKLREHFELQVSWLPFEIHPDNPPQGRPVSELGYPPEQWNRMMANLEAMAKEEGLALAPRTFTTNSHQALLLAEAVKEQADGAFSRLHQRLFEAYFRDRENIGDPEVLSVLATASGVTPDIVSKAWSDPVYERRLRGHTVRAMQIGLQGVPAFIIGSHVLAGALPTEALVRAARQAAESRIGS